MKRERGAANSCSPTPFRFDSVSSHSLFDLAWFLQEHTACSKCDDAMIFDAEGNKHKF
jgi:hypothetical protein